MKTQDIYRSTTVDRGPLVSFLRGLEAFAERLNRQRALYNELWLYAHSTESKEQIVKISDPVLFAAVLQSFGPILPEQTPLNTLEKLYDAAFDRSTGALITANRGATLWCLSPKSETPYLTRHIGMSIYMPGLGLETVNAGLVGDVYQGTVVCRSESACTPSFLFGSQRCNCSHQWDSFRELAAHFNPSLEPQLDKTGFEAWVQAQCKYHKGRHIFQRPGPGFLFVHLDSQNGMGSGATTGEFCLDLFNRASMRHRGEYSAEQILGTTMAGGFKAIGINPDPRQQDGLLGYRITPIVLRFLGISRDVVLLSNNLHKLSELKRSGFQVQRIRSLGAVNQAGALEAEQRGTEFGHLDIDAQCVSFDDEINRVQAEIKAILFGKPKGRYTTAEQQALAAGFSQCPEDCP